MIMFVLRVFAQLMLAAALMLLGYDALNALETGHVNPLSVSGLAQLIGERAGLGTMLDLETGLRAVTDWPGWVHTPLLWIVTAPAFLAFGLLGILFTWLFRHRED